MGAYAAAASRQPEAARLHPGLWDTLWATFRGYFIALVLLSAPLLAFELVGITLSGRAGAGMLAKPFAPAGPGAVLVNLACLAAAVAVGTWALRGALFAIGWWVSPVTTGASVLALGYAPYLSARALPLSGGLALIATALILRRAGRPYWEAPEPLALPRWTVPATVAVAVVLALGYASLHPLAFDQRTGVDPWGTGDWQGERVFYGPPGRSEAYALPLRAAGLAGVTFLAARPVGDQQRVRVLAVERHGDPREPAFLSRQFPQPIQAVAGLSLPRGETRWLLLRLRFARCGPGPTPGLELRLRTLGIERTQRLVLVRAPVARCRK